MNFLKIKGTWLCVAALLCVSLASADSRAKKGFAYAENKHSEKEFERRLGLLNVSWYYTWIAKTRVKKNEKVQFVPMIWGDKKWSLDPLPSLRVTGKNKLSSPLLGFNEPDGEKQANMSVEKALDLWGKLEKTDRRLGSPATVHPDNEWMKKFMKGVEERNLRVDFVCIHWYGGNNPKGLLQKAEQAYKLYQKPIWITEFAVADWNAKKIKDNKHSKEDVAKFMREVLPMLEKADYIERYSWFTAKPDHPNLGTSALFDEKGNLTELGKIYADHGVKK